jgi:hypothetical protein
MTRRQGPLNVYPTTHYGPTQVALLPFWQIPSGWEEAADAGGRKRTTAGTREEMIKKEFPPPGRGLGLVFFCCFLSFSISAGMPLSSVSHMWGLLGMSRG